ncbi:hypothetical protein O159_06020 [Leifsonia xyli subsp. cynodontis DSM 46306]|uniref:Uncharacterized protein n=1 Tax=Leifsonia xyli subsp. cynodontis DSM 46306 TaxID=1389489 RepID=U3P5Q3_LEIXC|nr:hypothetical protein [Leifsonia xyli]AGW40789.1 hypothetical protein O159_06020 [Leifsonia xyli subsp. cynodontis DSM 46306]
MTAWSIPAFIASALISAESGDAAGASQALGRVRFDRLGPFWALFAAVSGRAALADDLPELTVDRLRVIEQFAGDTPASNHDRGLFAAALVLIQLAAGRPAAAIQTLTGFDDGRESTLLVCALAGHASGGADAVVQLIERVEARRVSAVTRVGAAAARIALVAPERRQDARARLDELSRNCGLENYAALIAEVASR